jgi:hypothetical protein
MSTVTETEPNVVPPAADQELSIAGSPPQQAGESDDRRWPARVPNAGWWGAGALPSADPDVPKTANPDSNADSNAGSSAGSKADSNAGSNAGAGGNAIPAPAAAAPSESGRSGDAFPLWPTPYAGVGRDQRGIGAVPRGYPGSDGGVTSRHARRPAVGVPAIVLFALLSGFFAWVSAEPLLLAAGHAEPGTATVTACAGSGFRRQCVATFTGRQAGFAAERVSLVGVAPHRERVGTSVPARMASERGRIAYAGSNGALHGRWAVGVALVLLCGLLILWVTGAARLPRGRGRSAAIALCFAGPLLLLTGIVLAAW